MKNKKGFTLIEILIVVLIIGILATIAVPQYRLAVEKSRYIQAMTLADSIWKDQQDYYLANGTYTNDIDDLDVTLPPYTKKSGKSVVYYPWGACQIANNNGTEVYCYTNTAMYLRSYRGQNRICVAYNDLAQKLCENLGGVFSYKNSAGAPYYIIP